MTATAAPPLSSSGSSRKVRPQSSPRHPLIQQHQPFPSTTSSFSIRHSTSSSSLFRSGDSIHTSFNGNSYNFSNHPLSYDRNAIRSHSSVDYMSSFGTGTQNANTTGTRSGTNRIKATTAPLFHLQDSASDQGSLYTIDNNSIRARDMDDDEEDSGSYFGTAGQDYMLKQKRSRRAMLLCVIDLFALIIFTSLSGWRAPETNGGNEELATWTWDWGRIPWPLTIMAVARISLMAFTVRYNHSNFNAAVIFVCVLITLLTMFEINMIIQHRLALSGLLIVQYITSILLTQLHWIVYSAHTPMSATLAYAYDPVLTESITFSRESRYMGNGSNLRATSFRRRTSYGTMSTALFDTVQELDEEQEEEEDDQDVFIKVTLNLKNTTSSPRHEYPGSPLSRERHDPEDEGASDGGMGSGNNEGEDDEDDEEHDMATLLAFQEARRQQVYAYSPTASSAVIPTRSMLSPQALPSNESQPDKMPLSWAFQGDSYSSSYDMRMAAAGSSGAAAVAGGLTVGYAPRKRSLRTNMDPNGTGRRTWTGGHNIIYSGIFVEDSDSDSDSDGDTDGDEGEARQEEELCDFQATPHGKKEEGQGTEHSHLDIAVKIDIKDIPTTDVDSHIKTEQDENGEVDVGDHTKTEHDQSVEVDVVNSIRMDADDSIKMDVDNFIAINPDDAIKVDHDQSIKVELDDVVKVVQDDVREVDLDVSINLDSGDCIKVDIHTETISTDSVIDLDDLEPRTNQAIEARPGQYIESDECHTSETRIEIESTDQEQCGTTSIEQRIPEKNDGQIVVSDSSDSLDSSDSSMPPELEERFHPRFKVPLTDTERETTVIEGPTAEPNITRDSGDEHDYHHGISTLRINVSSRKEITAVMCAEDDCEEHPYQENPAAELESVMGPGFTSGNIIHLDIKESSTSAMEQTGDGINDFEDSSLPGTMRGPPNHCTGTMETVENEKPLPVIVTDMSKNCGDNSGDESHGSKDVRLRERIETTRIELDANDPALVAILAGSNPESLRIADPATETEENADDDDVHRRIHVCERIETITKEEDHIDFIGIDGAIVQPELVPIMGSTADGAGVGIFVTDDPSSVIIGPTQPMPGQFIGIGETDRRSGVITWGVADDIPLYDDDRPYVRPVPAPAVYVPQRRPAIIQPLLPPPVEIARPIKPIIAVGPTPRHIIASPPQPMLPIQPCPRPIFQVQPQPRMAVRPPSMVYAPPPRPMIIPPRPQLIPAPIIQPTVPMIAPPPQSIIQEPLSMIGPSMAVLPQPAMVAPSPITGPSYGTYETIVPGTRGVGVGAIGGVAGPLSGRYSVASIYDADRSVASIYDGDEYSIASVYDGGTIVSIDGNGPFQVGAPVGVLGQQPYSEVSYGHHVATAAHMPRQAESLAEHMTSSYDKNLAPATDARFHGGHGAEEAMVPLYQSRDVEISAYSAGHLPSQPQQTEIPTHHYINHSGGRHAAFPSDSANTEVSYQELELEEKPEQLQEIAIETYYDTTRSQLKVREQHGKLIADITRQLKKRQEQQQRVQHQLQESPPVNDQPRATSPSTVSLLSQSLHNQNQHQHQPPTLNIPKPPSNPPPVRLLANRGIATPLVQARRVPIAPRSPKGSSQPGVRKGTRSQVSDDDDINSRPILSSSFKTSENIMLRAREQKQSHDKPAVVDQQQHILKDSKNVRSLISESVTISKVTTTVSNAGQSLSRNTSAMVAQPKPRESVPAYATSTTANIRKAKRKQHIPAMSRLHLHPVTLNDGIMACWNNEFGTALEIFKEHKNTYPRWSLAAAEVHIVRQLISGQLSEADSELTEALHLSEKVASRILDKKQELESSFMGYRTICSADASLATMNDNTLRQNYKWDCEMSFYDTLLYRGILQLTSAPDTKGTFSDIKGGLQLRRAWKGYMRIKQEMEMAKEKWQRLSGLAEAQSKKEIQQTSAPIPRTPTSEQNHGAGGEHFSSSAHSAALSKDGRPSRPNKNVTMPITIPTASSAPPPSSRRNIPLSTSQTSDSSRWSIFGKRTSWNQSATSLSNSPAESSDIIQDSERNPSKFLGSSPSTSKGLASVLRDQAKAVEEIKTAVRVLEDTEDYLLYGIGLFYFIVSIVPKSLLPALRRIGLQTNHEQGIKNLESVFSRKNGRAPFAALYLLINYLFLPRGMNDPNISLSRAAGIINECLKSYPNGSSYLLMACHHARKTGNMIPVALNHITRGIQTCEAAGIPSINYRFELGLTFFIHQEFDKAADIFEILWRRFITTWPIGGTGSVTTGGPNRRRKGRSSSMSYGTESKKEPFSNGADGASVALEEEEEDDFELAPFCGLCLIACKVVMRLGQEGYFEYGRSGFGHQGFSGFSSPILGFASDPTSGSKFSASDSTTPPHYPQSGLDFDLLMAAQEVLTMMAGPELISTLKSAAGSSIFEHVKSGSNHSTWSTKDTAETGCNSNPQLLTPPAHAGKLNRFNKFAWNQCQKSLHLGRISPFLPLVILYLRRDLAYMRPVLLRKYRTLLETIWKSVQYTSDADTQAIYLLLSAVVHRQLLPDDATFSYTALTDCLLLESTIRSEMWVIPHCHYELGELLFKKLHLPQAALEQFQWIVKGPGKETRPASNFFASATASSNPRLSVFGGGYPSDTVTSMIESAAANQAPQTAHGSGNGHAKYPSTASNHRLSQLFPNGHFPPMNNQPANPPNPTAFYNSRYKKFEFSQALRQRSSICIEQIQKLVDSGDLANTPGGSRRASISASGEPGANVRSSSTSARKHPVEETMPSSASAIVGNDRDRPLKRQSLW